MNSNKLQRYYRQNLMKGMDKVAAMKAAQALIEQDNVQIPRNRELVKDSLAYSDTLKRTVCIPTK
jgi:hypothetical protein